jgi:hypothetical protein
MLWSVMSLWSMVKRPGYEMSLKNLLTSRKNGFVDGGRAARIEHADCRAVQPGVVICAQGKAGQGRRGSAHAA